MGSDIIRVSDHTEHTVTMDCSQIKTEPADSMDEAMEQVDI
jgi:hypothetical protein